MRNLLKILLTTLFSLTCMTTAQSDTLTLRRTDGSIYEMEGEVKSYRDKKFVVALTSAKKKDFSLKEVQTIKFLKAGFNDKVTVQKPTGIPYTLKGRVRRYKDGVFAIAARGSSMTFPASMIQAVEFSVKKVTIQPSTYFPIQIGNFWEYEYDRSNMGEEKREIVGIEEFAGKKSIKIRTLRLGDAAPNNIRFSYYSVEPKGVFEIGYKDGISPPKLYRRPKPILLAPLSEDSSWQWVEKIGPDYAIYKFRVLSSSPMTVPAGTFKNCLRIEENRIVRRRNLTGPAVYASQINYWYVPNVGLIQESFSRTRYRPQLNKQCVTVSIKR